MKYFELIVWQKAMDFVELVYQIVLNFPSSEKYGLVSQLQRAAVSIPSNIAEGHGRKSTAIYLNHLSIAFGSLMEVETQLQIACRLKYFGSEKLNEYLIKSEEIGKMLNSLMFSLKKVKSTNENP